MLVPEPVDEPSEVELSEVDGVLVLVSVPAVQATRTVPATPAAAKAAVIPPTLRSPFSREVNSPAGMTQPPLCVESCWPGGACPWPIAPASASDSAVAVSPDTDATIITSSPVAMLDRSVEPLPTTVSESIV